MVLVDKMSTSHYLFPQGFRWGTATSSHQVEGNLTNNDWAAAERRGGYVYHNQSAGLACDWWNRAEEDFDRMVDLGQNAHRLSIEWSRIEPEPGKWDEHALDRYREMLVGLRQRGIEPMVTLHHFTNPLWLCEQGSWENEQIVSWFERYTRKVVSALGDLTGLWCTINEPNVMLSQGYAVGRWPPGKKDLRAALHATVNLARAHAASYRAIHQLVPGASVGIAKHIMVWEAWRSWLPLDQMMTRFIEHIFHHLLLGILTEGIVRIPGRRPFPLPEASHTLDWLGVNYYQRYRIRFNPTSPGTLFIDMKTRPDQLVGPGGWGEVHPRGMFDTLESLWKKYRLPFYITENGVPDETDTLRPGFIVRHLYQLWEAIEHGIPVNGYYFWSLLDNFEWTEGYDPRFRFGLIGVDFKTQERQIRQSGHLYGAISRLGGLNQEVISRFTPELVPGLFGT
jgi:beta-glucosidase